MIDFLKFSYKKEMDFVGNILISKNISSNK